MTEDYFQIATIKIMVEAIVGVEYGYGGNILKDGNGGYGGAN